VVISKVKASDVMRALEQKHTQKINPDQFFAEVSCGSGGSQRLDAVAIKPSWTKPQITGYEIKVSRRDFMHANEKLVKELKNNEHCKF